MSTNEAAERLYAFFRKMPAPDPMFREQAKQNLDDALVHERSAGAAPLDVEALWSIIDKRWPHHVEGSNGMGGTQHTSWDVIDPAIPTREWLDGVAAEYARLSEGTDR